VDFANRVGFLTAFIFWIFVLLIKVADHFSNIEKKRKALGVFELNAPLL